MNLLPDSLNARASIRASDGGAVCRIAPTDADTAGRDQLLACMHAARLELEVDRIGNIFGIRAGGADAAPVMSGTHIEGWPRAAPRISRPTRPPPRS